MANLAYCRGPFGVNGVAESFQARNHRIVVDAQLIKISFASDVDVESLGADESRAAAGTFPNVVQVALCDRPVRVGEVLLHGRGNDPVSKTKRADLAFRE
jgi:hypothetical protein